MCRNNEIIKIIKAYESGIIVEIFGNLNIWEPLPKGYSDWNFERFEYRIKITHPELYVTYARGKYTLHNSIQDAIKDGVVIDNIITYRPI